jgi:hypothetical protein
MRLTNEIFIPIPKPRNTHCKVEINGSDMTTRVIKSSFVYPCTTGIGTFTINLSNAHGQLNGLFSEGQTVKFYADNTDATYLQFWGRIDFVKNNISDSGQFLEIEGRHRSYLLTESLICHQTTTTSPAQVLKDIIDILPASYGFTYNNVNADAEVINVEWNYKPFWDCVGEICNYSGFDVYVDNDLDFHYFEENSILNEQEAIVEGDNFLNTKDWGTNNTYEKTRVTVIGQDDEGLPIIYTAKIVGETDIKEVFIRDGSANTEAKVKDVADANLAKFTNRAPQATIKSYGLQTIKPGDNLWILIPRQQIHGQYKVIQITHTFGAEVGGWRTECLIEEEDVNTAQLLQKVMQKTNIITQSENINKMNYSYNFDFNTDSGVHSTTQITGGVLKTDGSASGTWISPTKALDTNATQYELRASGDAIPGTTFYVSSDGGTSWQIVTALKTLYDFAPIGQNLKVKVTLNSASTQIKSLALLYS